ncbi:metal ABC transporter ATP-binding protein [Micrococcales bacterium 31B]|nr:metal ABC transporter ATP-binding protein [Micrococcales bacterium 31B]
MTVTSPSPTPAVQVRGAELAYGSRVLWRDLNLDIAPGEFVAVLGPNGAGKTSLLRVLLGQARLTAGSVKIGGRPVRRGSSDLGLVPQNTSLDGALSIRGRDVVGFGLDGHRWGVRLRSHKERISEVLREVGAADYADVPVHLLSGGERQRLRIAQALISNPKVLLCDEPLASLDLHHQRSVSDLIDAKRRERNVAVVFVTHEINPILRHVDRVLYIVDGQYRVGTPDEVMTTENLTELFGSRVDVMRQQGRIIVIGAESDAAHHCHAEGGH